MSRSAKFNAFYLLTLISVIYLFDYADRKVMSALFDAIKSDWQLSDSELGMLNGIVSLMISVFVLPLSVIVDRWSRKYMIAIMVFIWSIATLMCAFAQNYNQLLFFRALTGLGEAAYAAAAVAMLTKVFPRKHRAKYIGIYDIGAPIGSGLGIILGGIILSKTGDWRNAFGIVAIPGIIMAILFLFIKDYHIPTIKNTSKKFSSYFVDIYNDCVYLFKIPTLRFVYAAYAIAIGLNTTLIDWLPTFYQRFHNLSEKQSSMFAGVLAVAALIGAPLGGLVSDIWEKRYKHAKAMVSSISILLSSIFLFFALKVTTINASIVLFLIFGINTVAFLAPATTMIQDVVKTRVRALSFGLNVLLMNLLAFAVPVIIGKISDSTDLQTALLFLPFLGIIPTIIFYFSRKYFHQDLKNA